MTQVVTALFETLAEAEAAARSLETAGVPRDDIGLVAHADGLGLEQVADGAGKGAGLGGMIGGAGGLLASLGLIAIPGIGPAVAGGWLAALAIGAAAGGAAGGLVGGLTHAGVAEEHAHALAEGVRRGCALLTARIADAQLDGATAALREAIDVDARGARYREHGWAAFDPAADPLTPEQIAAERASHLFV